MNPIDSESESQIYHMHFGVKFTLLATQFSQPNMYIYCDLISLLATDLEEEVGIHNSFKNMIFLVCSAVCYVFILHSALRYRFTLLLPLYLRPTYYIYEKKKKKIGEHKIVLLLTYKTCTEVFYILAKSDYFVLWIKQDQRNLQSQRLH